MLKDVRKVIKGGFFKTLGAYYFSKVFSSLYLRQILKLFYLIYIILAIFLKQFTLGANLI